MIIAATSQVQDHQSSLAIDAQGNFVVVWAKMDSALNYTWNQDIRFQRYSASGAKLGGVVTVATEGYSPSVAMQSDGDFLVVWASLNLNFPTDVIFPSRISGQQYTAGGQPIGATFLVDNAYDRAVYPAAAIDDADNLIVSWSDYDRLAAPGSPASRGIWTKRYAADGSTEKFLVSTSVDSDPTKPSHQTNPSVALMSSGNFVIAFSGYGPGDDDGVFAQRYSVSSPAVNPLEATADAEAVFRTSISAVWESDLREDDDILTGSRKNASNHLAIDLILADAAL